ncbi:bifunctional tetrahydrofolate synthase/dihydrofolate synthase [Gammaproteobacteria bacterium]|nr:bifunctional tetrahydrofolate synthase/dihydrofolate synthase [Gammaproteobacteria bacterium]
MKEYPSNLQEWLDWQQTLHPQNIDFKLERIKSVYEKLDIKSIASKVIIVAGTNGKGSTVAILESILFENKFSVGTFTSPHIKRYNERIKIDKQEVTSAELIESFEMINKLRGETTLTYFEFATLTAFYLFSKKDLDYVVLEVGLGGRLDATNIIDSNLSIITSIGIDHTEFLGTTIDSIALEKAGVMRPFAPCIYADENPPSVLLSYAKKNGSNFLYNQNDFFTKISNNTWTWKSNMGKELILPLLPLRGDFQYNHAAAALQALEIIEPTILGNTKLLKNGIANISLMGRYQKISLDPEIIIDVAHNADSAEKLSDNLNKEDKKNTIAVIGVLKDKDVYSLIKPMINNIDKWYCGTINSDRGMNSDEIKTRMSSTVSQKNIETFNSIDKACSQAMASLGKNDRLIVYGSFYTVSEFLDYYELTSKRKDII